MSLPALLVAVIVIVPEPVLLGVPLILRVDVAKLTPEGSPLALYVGAGEPSSTAGTVNAGIAVLAVQFRAAPPVSVQLGATAAATTVTLKV